MKLKDKLNELLKNNKLNNEDYSELFDMASELEGKIKILNGDIDLDTNGETFSLFLEMLDHAFLQNDIKNFLTITLEKEDKEYEIILQKVEGQSTAQQLSEKDNRIKELEQELKSIKNRV